MILGRYCGVSDPSRINGGKRLDKQEMIAADIAQGASELSYLAND